MGGYYTSKDERPLSLPGSYLERPWGGVQSFTYEAPLTSTVRSYRTGKGEKAVQTNDEILASAKDYARTSTGDFTDTGHEFSLVKQEAKLSHKNVTLRVPPSASYPEVFYQGPLVIGYTGSEFSSMPAISDVNVGYYGSQAINATIPTKPHASYAQFIGELKDLPTIFLKKSAFSSKTQLFRETGGQYLNVEFGWKPFISDVLKIIRAVKDSKKIIAQYDRDSGRIVRRKYYFEPRDPSVKTDVVGTRANFYFIGDGNPNFTDLYYKGNTDSRHTVTTTSFERYWFSGAYTYYLDGADDARSRMSRYEELANQVLGTRITPETLWQLAPWSWLIDWWVDIGTITGNAVAFSSDKLVLRYGYLMRETVVRRLHIQEDVKFYSGLNGNITSLYTRTTKDRVRATPYGFGVDLESLSDSQWRILAALGMTRSGAKRIKRNE